MNFIRNSLMGRLIAAATFWILIGLVIAGITLASVFRAHVEKQLNDDQLAHLNELIDHTEINDKYSLELVRPLSDPRYAKKNSGYYWEIQKQGKIVARSNSLQGPVLAIPTDDLPTVIAHRHEIQGPTGFLLTTERAYWPDPATAPLRFIVGMDYQHLTGVMSRFNITLVWSLSILAIAMIIASGIFILFATKPLNDLQRALERVRMGKEKKLVGTFPNEVMPIVNDLNTMLVTNADMMQRARAQAGNLAHGLKTSLAILFDEADQMTHAGLLQHASTISEQSRRIQILIDYHMARARAAVASSAPGTSTNVTAVTENIISALTRLYQDRNIKVDQEGLQGLLVACDPQDLNEILANLLDNAFKHAKSRICLSTTENQVGSHIELIIEDDGPGLPAEAWDVVFNIGERWDSRTNGSGLGLPIVHDLTTLYGGYVRLSEARLGGLRVTLALPGVEL